MTLVQVATFPIDISEPHFIVRIRKISAPREDGEELRQGREGFLPPTGSLAHIIGCVISFQGMDCAMPCWCPQWGRLSILHLLGSAVNKAGALPYLCF